MGACIHYDGILPFNMTLAPEDHVPFHVCGLSERDKGQHYAGYAERVFNIWQAWQPDVIISAQDFPYHEVLRATPIDWSTTAHIVITPVDGAPVAKNWLDVAPQFDGLLTISEFGVEALRAGGVRADLCPPGVDTSAFRPLDAPARAQLRERMGIDTGAFVVGAMAMNQGRKNFPAMVRAFADAYRDVPEAVLYLDTERVSGVGWNIPDQLMRPHGIDAARVKFRDDAVRAGLSNLNDRYNLLDLHMVISEREGFGLPHIEAMAAGVTTITLDYCSGREIVGDGERGWLVPAVEGEFGTWGGAQNMFPDRDGFVRALREAHDNAGERQARAARGLRWVRSERQWSRAADAVQQVLDRVLEQRGADLRKKHEPAPQAMPALQVANVGGNGHAS